MELKVEAKGLGGGRWGGSCEDLDMKRRLKVGGLRSNRVRVRGWQLTDGILGLERLGLSLEVEKRGWNS